MKKLNRLVYLGTVAIILVLVIFEYSSSAPAHFFNQYQSVAIDSGKIDSAQEKEILIELSDKYQVNVLFNQRQIDKKAKYTVYSTQPITLPRFPNLYNSMENQEFINLDSSRLYGHELFFEITPNQKQLIADLKAQGMNVELYQQYVGYFTTSKSIPLIIILTIILNLTLILISFNNNLKSYGIRVLEGYSMSMIMLSEIAEATLNILGFGMLLSIGLFIIQRPELYVYKWFGSIIIIYILIIIIFKLLIIKLFEYDFITNYLNGFNSSNSSLNILLTLKVVAFGYLIISIPLLFNTISSITDLRTQIDSYSKFDNIVISQENASSISDYFNYEEFERMGSEYYKNTVEPFDGVLYNIDDYSAIINYNALNYIDILAPDGSIISESDLSPTKMTYLVPESKVDSFHNEIGNVVPIMDDQHFLSIDLHSFSSNKQVVPERIEYYPRNFENFGYSNVNSAISSGGYYLNVPGENKYETLKPYIQKADAESLIVSAPSITSKMEETLSTYIEKAIEKTYIIVLSMITVFLITIFSIRTYIKLNTKSIAIRTLEGIDIYHNLKVLYLIVLFELILVIIYVSMGKASLIPSVTWLVAELALISILSKRVLKQNLSEFMKGNL